MDLVFHKRYADADTYRGKAHYANLAGSSLRTGLPPLDDLYRHIAITAIEAKVSISGGRMLETKIYREDSVFGGIPTYVWDVNFWFYFPADVEALVDPATILAIINAIIALIVVIGVFLSLSKLQEIIWGPPEMPSWARVIFPLAIAIVAMAYAYSKFIKK